jgi:hypothetical protein
MKTREEVELDLELINMFLFYDKETGLFTWKRKYNNRNVGDSAGHTNKDGYIRISIFNGKYAAHRIAWVMEYNTYPKGQIDHINGNRSDNRIENLRDVSDRSNKFNRTVVLNRFGVMGVHKPKKGNKYEARINLNGQQVTLGRFYTIEEAAACYEKAKAERDTQREEYIPLPPKPRTVMVELLVEDAEYLISICNYGNGVRISNDCRKALKELKS